MKWILAATGLLAVLALAAEFVANRVVDAEFVRDRLAESPGGDSLRVSLDEVSFSLFARRIEARNVVVARPGRATVAAERVVAAGVPLRWRDRSVIDVGSIELDRALIYVHPTAADGGDSAPDTVATVRIGDFRIRDGTALAWRPGAENGPSRVLVRDLHVEGDDVLFDRRGRPSTPGGRFTWRGGPFSRTSADGLMLTAFDSLQVSTDGERFVAHGARYEPTPSDSGFFARLETRKDRIRATARRIEARGIDFEAFPRRGFIVRTIQFDSIDVEVFSNRRIPSGDADPWLPRRTIRSVEGDLRVDSILARGRVVYRELPPHTVARPGRIAFEEIGALLSGVSNADDAPPMRFEADFRTYGAAAGVQLDVEQAADTLSMGLRGRVASVDLTRLNELTIPLQGIEIQDGRLEGLRFDITVDGPTAGGTVWAAYRDLDVQVVDRETGEGDLIDDIKSFVANNFQLRGDNMPDGEEGEEARPGAVEYYVRPSDPFFTRLWAPIRSGLMAAAEQ